MVDYTFSKKFSFLYHSITSFQLQEYGVQNRSKNKHLRPIDHLSFFTKYQIDLFYSPMITENPHTSSDNNMIKLTPIKQASFLLPSKCLKKCIFF